MRRHLQSSPLVVLSIGQESIPPARRPPGDSTSTGGRSQTAQNQEFPSLAADPLNTYNA